MNVTSTPHDASYLRLYNYNYYAGYRLLILMGQRDCESRFLGHIGIGKYVMKFSGDRL